MLLSAREAVVGQIDAGGLFEERWYVTEAVIRVECSQWEVPFRKFSLEEDSLLGKLRRQVSCQNY